MEEKEDLKSLGNNLFIRLRLSEVITNVKKLLKQVWLLFGKYQEKIEIIISSIYKLQNENILLSLKDEKGIAF